MRRDHGSVRELNLERAAVDAHSDIIEQGLTTLLCTVHVASIGRIMEEQVDHNAVGRVGLDLVGSGGSGAQ